jgi:IS1 family transposase
MNELSTERRAQVVSCLVEGNSIRATVRMTGVAKNTVAKLLVDLGTACAEYQDGAIQDLTCERIQCDEIWSFCYAKAKNVPEDHQDEYGYGDVWTWVAIDADTKLVPSYLVGERSDEDARVFLNDLASRLTTTPQITTDGLGSYGRFVPQFFGPEVAFAQQRKQYVSNPDHKYSPPTYRTVETVIRNGEPDPAHISTSYVERQNLTIRMGMRRFTRLTNAFSKKVENLAAAVSLHFMHYNFARVHQSLTVTDPDGTRTKRTPAMAAGIADHVWTLAELCGLLEPQAPASN